MSGYTYSFNINVLEHRNLPIKECKVESSNNDLFIDFQLFSDRTYTNDISLTPFTLSNIYVESLDSEIPEYNALINSVQDKLSELKIIKEKAILEKIDKEKTLNLVSDAPIAAENKHVTVELPTQFKSPMEILSACDTETKKKIISLRKQIITFINVIAGTLSQIKKTTDSVINILTQSKMISPDVYFLMLYTIIDSVFNCCYPGGQIYIKSSAVWPFSHLLSVVLQEEGGVPVYQLITSKHKLTHIFKIENLGQIETNCNGKAIEAFVRLHISLFVLLKDYDSIWTWFALTVNEHTTTPSNIYMPIILFAGLDVAGHFVYNAFNKQFAKIVFLINEDLLPKFKNLTIANIEESQKEMYKMYRERLETIISEFINNKKFNIPQGYDMKQKEETLHANI